MTHKTCSVCGTDFVTTGNNQKYCPECMIEQNKKVRGDWFKKLQESRKNNKNKDNNCLLPPSNDIKCLRCEKYEYCCAIVGTRLPGGYFPLPCWYEAKKYNRNNPV